ncbi:MAG: transglycosylase SLT domain-containing protein [Thermodesulfobacteriota bacterium]
MKSLVWMLLAWVLFRAVPVRADIYRYIDANGVSHFTNVPVSSGYEIFIKEEPAEEETVDDYYSTDKYDHLILQASRRHGLDFSLIKALIKVESNFNPRAISKKGAKGLMQIMPVNFDTLNISDPFSPWENIMGGTHYLKSMLTRFDGKLPLALAAYNAGPAAVDLYKRIPPYPETEDYVRKVMNYYHAMNQ